MTSRGYLDDFKLLELQLTTFWKALPTGPSAERTRLFALALGVPVKQLRAGKVPMDRVEGWIARLEKFFTTKQVQTLERAWYPVQRTRNELFDTHAGLISRVVRRYLSGGILGEDDLWQEGAMGLVKGIYRFDWHRGYRFSTYATFWIRHCIARAVANRRDTIRIPVHAQAKRLEVPRVVESTVGINVPSQEPSALAQMVAFEDMNELHDAIDLLEPMERDIIERRCGFKGEPQTLEQIGETYSLSRERIRQIEQAALVKLREELTA